MQDRFSVQRTDALGLQFVDVALSELVHRDTHLFRAGDLRADHFRGKLVDNRAPVLRLVYVGVRAHTVGRKGTGSLGVDLGGKGQRKPVRLGSHLVNLERHLAFPCDAVECEAFAATCPPATVGATDEQRAVRVHIRADVPRAEAL